MSTTELTALDWELLGIIEENVRLKYKDLFEKMESELLEEWQEISKREGMGVELETVKISPQITLYRKVGNAV